jgi:anti-sigma B factor antagonist
MPSDFAVHTQITGRIALLAVRGELDLVSCRPFEHAIGQLADLDVELVIVDLRGLDFMDSTGLHLVLQAQTQAQESGRRFGLVRGPEQVQKLFDLTGLSDALTIVESPDQLLEVPDAP